MQKEKKEKNKFFLEGLCHLSTSDFLPTRKLVKKIKIKITNIKERE